MTSPDEQREQAETDMLAVQTPDELTAQEARDLADELGTQLYRAQDALSYVEECCVIADREQRAITTADVREWLKGAQCGRQLAADNPNLYNKIVSLFNGPPPWPPPEQSTGHIYLSTGCWHDNHTYCQSMTGLNGTKRPGECKFCGAKCVCPCHQPKEPTT